MKQHTEEKALIRLVDEISYNVVGAVNAAIAGLNAKQRTELVESPQPQHRPQKGIAKIAKGLLNLLMDKLPNRSNPRDHSRANGGRLSVCNTGEYGTELAREFPRLDVGRVQQEAVKLFLAHLEVGLNTIKSDEEWSPKIIQKIVRAWDESHATGIDYLVLPYINNGQMTQKKMKDFMTNYQQQAVAIVAAFIAATALVVVAWTRRRRNRKSPIAPIKRSPSKDYESLWTLIDVGADDGLVSDVLHRIRAPWAWKLTAMPELPVGVESEEQYLELLRLLSAHDGSCVQKIKLEVGTPLKNDDIYSLSADEEGWIRSDDDTVWITREFIAAGYQYREGDSVQVLHKAMVRACTADWWALQNASREVANVIDVINAHREDLIGDEEDAYRWTAPMGFFDGEILREEIDESALDAWRNHLMEAFRKYYSNNPERQLERVGAAGEPVHVAMNVVDENGELFVPVGDHVVSETVVRDEVPQYGIMTPGGNALLFACVRAEPKGGNI